MSGKSTSDTDYKKLTDEELIKKFQNGDIDAYNEIVFRFKDKIVNFFIQIYRKQGRVGRYCSGYFFENIYFKAFIPGNREIFDMVVYYSN
ncbi:MAG: hypothetical protein R2942_08395 [Ignavibacteria bacterium]